MLINHYFKTIYQYQNFNLAHYEKNNMKNTKSFFDKVKNMKLEINIADNIYLLIFNKLTLIFPLF